MDQDLNPHSDLPHLVAPPAPPATLSTDDQAIMAMIRNGADVFSPENARRIRALDERCPGLISITDAKAAEGAAHPYFRASLTDAGRAELEASW